MQEKTYQALEALKIPFERVDTDEAITMDDCIQIDDKLDMKMVKTLFLCNRQQTAFFLFITTGDKPFRSKDLHSFPTRRSSDLFRSKDFSSALKVSRISFAPAELMLEMLGTKIGAATVFSVLLDVERDIQVVFDKEVYALRQT